MHNPKKLSPFYLLKLRNIDKMHGGQKAFVAKSGVCSKAFKNVVSEGYSTAAVIAKIESALKEPEKTVDYLIQHVESKFALFVEELKERRKVSTPKERETIDRRINKFADKRNNNTILAFVLWKETRLSHKEISDLLGYKHFSGVIKSIQRAHQILEEDKEYGRYLWDILGTV